MAAFQQFVSHARRRSSHLYCAVHRTPTDLGFSSSFIGVERLFCSTTADESPEAPLVKPVTYSMKPKIESEESQSPAAQGGRRPRDNRPPLPREPDADSPSLTREDFRYVKDQPSISPVSYPSRVAVAPLPEDKVGGEEENKEVDTSSNRMLPRNNVKAEDQKVVPFPSLIKLIKNKQKPLLDLQEAIKEVKANAKAKFDETVEAHVNLGVDPRRGDQMVRGATTLPHGTGKAIKVAVFAEGAAAEEARAAGADIVGGDELIEEIRKGGGKLSFDKCISTPFYMPRLGKIARILGPRGLMPNPKLGSVTNDVAAAVTDAKRGRIDFKIDKTAIVHVGLGKVSFTEESLRENVGAFVNALLLAKPVGLKKTSKYAGYVNSFSLSSTMGPGFPVSVQSLSMAADHYNKLQLK